MEKTTPVNATETKPFSTSRDGKWLMDSIREHVENKDRLARVIRILDSYDLGPADSIAQGMQYGYGNKVAELDAYLKFLDRPDVHDFLNSMAHYAGWTAKEMMKIYALPEGERLLGEAMRGVLLVGKRIKEPGNLRQDTMGMMARIAKSTGDATLMLAAGRMVSKYSSKVDSYVISEVETLAGKATTTKESMAAFIRIFDSDVVTSYINRSGEFGFSHSVVKDLGTRSRSRLRSKNLEKAYHRTLSYSANQAALLWNEDILAVMRKQGEEGHPWVIYEAYKRFTKSGKVSQGSLNELTLALGKLEPEVAISVLRTVGSIWDNLTKEKSAPQSEFVRIIRLLENTGKPEGGGYDYERMLTEVLRDKMDALVTDKRSFAILNIYFKSERMLPAPTKENIGSYEGLANSYLKRRYGLERDLTIAQVEMLFTLGRNSGGEEAMRQGAIHFVNKAREENVRHYSISIGGASVPIDYPKEVLTRGAVLTIIGQPGKDPEAEAPILQIVGEKNINKARNNFNTAHRKMLPDLIASVKESRYDSAAELLRTAKDEAINDVLDAASYREINIGNSKFVRASEDKNPLNYDSRVQIACVYMPSGAHIFEYCADENVTLVKYEIGGKTLGSAICYMEDGIFLVDSVEGHRTFRKPEIFEVVYNDLIQRALDRGAAKILFSTDSNNETPDQFENHLKSKGLKESDTKMRLASNTYLEAGESNIPAGHPQEVTGYLKELKKDSGPDAQGIAGTLRKE